MVQPRYLLDEPAPRSAVKLFVDQQVMPRLINAAGCLEALLERGAVATRRSPIRTVAAAFAVGVLIGALARRPAEPAEPE